MIRSLVLAVETADGKEPSCSSNSTNPAISVVYAIGISPSPIRSDTAPNPMLTHDQIRAIRERAEKATAGPWQCQVPALTVGFPRGKIKPLKIEGRLYNHPMLPIDDAEFIAHARTDIPALLAHIEELEAKLAEEKRKEIDLEYAQQFLSRSLIP